MNNLENSIHQSDKEGIRSFVNMINENHDTDISVSFSWLANKERFNFRVKGKLIVKDNIDTAIAFLDGVLVSLDLLQD